MHEKISQHITSYKHTKYEHPTTHSPPQLVSWYSSQPLCVYKYSPLSLQEEQREQTRSDEAVQLEEVNNIWEEEEEPQGEQSGK
jgi:hypothetical protein